MPNLRSLPFLTTSLLLGSLAAQGLVGVSFNGTLTRVDLATGVGTPLGSTGFSWEGGLARVGDVLYTNDLGGNLRKIDPWTGAVTPGPATVPALNSIRAMTADGHGKVYVIQNGGGQVNTTTPDLLYTVDVKTGAATLIGSTSSFTAIQGLAFDRTGQLYGFDTTAGLVRINPSNAATSDVNPAIGGSLDIQEIALAPNGMLYGACYNLYTVDVTTGAFTLVGGGGYSDLRGIEYVEGPRIYDNGPLVTHPGGGYGGADLSMVETGIGLTDYGAWSSYSGNIHLAEDFQTDGPWLVDSIELFGLGAPPLLGVGVRLAIYDDNPFAGGQLVPGSPTMATVLGQQPGVLVWSSPMNTFRALQSTPTATTWTIYQLRVQFATPIALDSSQLASHRYWLRFAFEQGFFHSEVPFVSTRGRADTGNALVWNGGSVQPVLDNGHPQALPFAFFGTALVAPGSVANLGGGCGGASGALAVRGALCAGGTVVHEVSGFGGLTGIVIGLTDPNTPISPLCGCVQHASTDVVIFPASRYDLVAPPGLGTGLEYRVQGLGADFTGTVGLPCGFGPGLSLVLTDAFRVRFW